MSAAAPKSLTEIALAIRVEPDMCDKCKERTKRLNEEATLKFLAARRRPERECGRCGESRTDVGPAGLCGACLEKIEKGAFLAEKIRQLPEELRQAEFKKMRDVANMSWIKRQLIAAAETRRSVYHWGGTGAGKTTSHAAIYRGMAYRMANVYWSPQRPSLLAIDADPQMAEVFARRACDGALFVDELGEAPAARWHGAALSALIDALWLRRTRACVFFAGNYGPDGLAAQLTGGAWGMDAAGADRIVSRLFQMCVEIHNESPDMRLEG